MNKRYLPNSCDVSRGVGSFRPDTDNSWLAPNAFIANLNIVIPVGREASTLTQRDIVAARWVVTEGRNTAGRIVVAGGV